MRRAARGERAAARSAGTTRSTSPPTASRDRSREHGPDAVGFYISGQLLTEDYYVFNKLAKGLIGTNNVDTNSRLCMSSAVAGYKMTLGADAPPACYDDLDHARRVFIAGSNTAWAHPILFRAHRGRAARQPAAEDHRRRPAPHRDRRRWPTCTCRSCPAPTSRCSTACCTCMLWEGLDRRAPTSPRTPAASTRCARVRDCTPREAAQVCGMHEADLVQAARWFAGLRRGTPRAPTLSLYCQGLNQSSQRHRQERRADQPAPGHRPDRQARRRAVLADRPAQRDGRARSRRPGQPAVGAPRPGQCRAPRRGGARCGASTTCRRRPARPRSRCSRPPPTAQIKALWIACTNPAQSMPDQATVRRALRALPSSSCVQEAFATTATCAFADLLLPATTWGEKDGTVTNSERRISRVRARGRAARRGARTTGRSPSTSRAGSKRGCAPRPRRRCSPTTTPEAVWNEHRESTRGRDLDITGLSYALLDGRARSSGPCPRARRAGRARLYEDGRFATADGRARFADAPYAPLAEPRDARYPFALTTGRLRDQWHGMSRTGTLGRLFGHVAEPSIEMHPQDMARRALGRRRPGARHLAARLASCCRCRPATRVAPAQAFIAMHWGEEFVSGAQQPAARAGRRQRADHAGVLPAVEAARAEARGGEDAEGRAAVAAAGASRGCRRSDALRAREALRALMPAFPFASLRAVRPRAQRRAVPRRRARGRPPADAARAHRSAARPRRRARRCATPTRGAASAAAMRLVGGGGDDARSRASCSPATRAPRPGCGAAAGASCRRRPTAARCWSPGATPPVAVRGARPPGCSCFDVSEREIVAALRAARTAAPSDALARAAGRAAAAAPTAARACPSCAARPRRGDGRRRKAPRRE